MVTSGRRWAVDSPGGRPGAGGVVVEGSKYAILDHLLEGCQVISFDYRYLYVNDAVAAQGKKSKDELIGQTMMAAYPGIDQAPFFATLKRCLIEHTPAELENEFAFEDGSTGWFLLKMEPVTEGLFILSIDITQRKRAELDVQDQVQRLQALRDIDQAIISSTDMTFALTRLVQKVTESLGVDAADILLLDPVSHELKFAAGHGFRTNGIKQSRLRLGQGHAGKAARDRRRVEIPDLTHTDEAFLRFGLIAEEGFISAYFVPLVAKGEMLGVLEVFKRSKLDPDAGWLDFLDTLAGQASIAIDSAQMFHDLQRSNLDLLQSYDTTIEGWSNALDLRDKETEGHTRRVTEMTVALAGLAGMPEAEIVHLRRGALLHDIGKMGVPDHILLKPSELTEYEWVKMRQHPVFAFELLHPIEYLRPALAIPHYHHERWDGKGYPYGLKAEAIPVAARLFAVVDVWDAVTHDRPYRPAWPEDKALQHIRDGSGSHFDPQAVELFLQLLNRDQRSAA